MMLDTQRWARQQAAAELKEIEGVIEVNDRAARTTVVWVHPSPDDEGLMSWGIYPRARFRELYVLRCAELRLEIKMLDLAIAREQAGAP